jgi:transcription antitermination factor NusG
MYNGELGVSKAVKIGDYVKIVQGPLADGMGTIIMMNRNSQRAKKKLSFNGRIWLTWLDYRLRKNKAF